MPRTAERWWELCGLTAVILDSVAPSAQSAAALSGAARQALELASQGLAGSSGECSEEGGAEGGEQGGQMLAGAMLLWRSGTALLEACDALLAPGLPPPLPLAPPPALAASCAALRRGCDPALRHAALHVLAREAQRVHEQLRLQQPPLRAEGEVEAEGDGLAPLHSRMDELLELLVGWEPAAMRRLARSGRVWVAHPFAVTDPSEALISQWEIAAARAALVDAHGTPAQLDRWAEVLWLALCLGPNVVEEGGVSLASVSAAVFESSAVHELPRLRLALLPSAWRQLRRSVPKPAAALPKRHRRMLAFLRRLPSVSDGCPRPTARWAALLGAANGEAEEAGPVWQDVEWRAVSAVLGLMARLPAESMPSEQLGWLLPSLLVLAQLAALALPRVAPVVAEEAGGALAGALRLAAGLARAHPAATAALLPPRALRRVMRWSHALPPAARPEELRGLLASRLAALLRPLCMSSVRQCGEAEGGKAALARCWPEWTRRLAAALGSSGTEGGGEGGGEGSEVSALGVLGSYFGAVLDAMPVTHGGRPPKRRQWMRAVARQMRSLPACFEAAGGGESAAVRAVREGAPSLLLAALLRCLTLWLRCHQRLDAVGITTPRPPALHAALRCSVRVLQPAIAATPPGASDGAGHAATAVELGPAAAATQAGAASLVDAVSGLPLEEAETRAVLALLLCRLRSCAAGVILGPQGRPTEPAEAVEAGLLPPSPHGTLRKLFGAADERTFAWLLTGVQSELSTPLVATSQRLQACSQFSNTLEARA